MGSGMGEFYDHEESSRDEIFQPAHQEMNFDETEFRYSDSYTNIYIHSVT